MWQLPRGAAKTTGYEAQTIHRLLELTGMPDEEWEGQAVHFE